MSERSEIGYLAERVRNGIGSSSMTLRDCAKESLDKLVELASVPTTYVPRDEVTEILKSKEDGRAWFSCREHGLVGRIFAEFWVGHSGEIEGKSPWSHESRSLHSFSDFLPVPEYLVRGIESPEIPEDISGPTQ